jgi:hypothetical protein
MDMRLFRSVAIAIMLAVTTAPSARAQGQVPAADPSAHYLFYQHGGWLEKKDKSDQHPKYGTAYEFDAIVAALSKRGFKVISEIRDNVRPNQYARAIVKAIRGLIKGGVPAKNISVVGHSKGGQITLLTSAQLGNPNVNYAIMASCAPESSQFRRSYKRFLRRNGDKLSGRGFAIYDDQDDVAGSCREAFEMSSSTATDEKVVSTGLGHGLFYVPNLAWIDPVTKWIKP